MKLKKCEYCGTEFDAALSQCPLCGKAVQPGAAEPQPVMPAAYKPAGGRGGKFSKKKGGHFAADPKKEKEAKSAENPYKIPKWMMVTICVILGLAVLMGAAFALYQLSWFRAVAARCAHRAAVYERGRLPAGGSGRAAGGGCAL